MKKINNATIVSICHKDKLKKTVRAMEYSLGQIDFDKKIIITEQNSNYQHDEIEIKELDGKIDLVRYNRICIEQLNSFIHTDFCLLIQWDGFILDGERWKDEFLQYDYIGSPWNLPTNAKNNIGNGGFSLRSKKFLEMSSKIEYNPNECEWIHPSQKLALPIAPEDWYLCYNNYEYLVKNEINFPTTKTAYKFSVEHSSALHPYNPFDISTYKSFGFHGDFNEAAMETLNV